MGSTTAGKYDTRSAERRFRDLMGSGPEYRDARRAAGRMLIAEFAALASRCALSPMLDRAKCSITVRGATVIVALDEEKGAFEVHRRIADTYRIENVPLAFNTFADMFEGASADPWIAPTPGALLPARSALDVLLEEVLNLAGVTAPSK